jgi:hypothetical protein
MTKSDASSRSPQAARTAVRGQLRAMFDKVAAQPVPEHILELVDVLEETQRAQERRDETA